ncbi:MAG: ABC transporter permease [Kangiellaceae bacterium]|nr:ABC transporter permease [Kangiellaceae bacterium]
MSESIQSISLSELSFAFIPVIIALSILFKWSLNARNSLYAISRMLIQLLLIGHFLSYIFSADSGYIILLLLAIMVFASSWIALGTVKQQRKPLFRFALYSILIGGGFTLLIMSQLVLNLKPWFLPQFIIPLVGMVFANGMNSVSLAAERVTSELKKGLDYNEARNTAVQASLIPTINSLFAVGLVSLPGMTTGQILSGVSPMVAVRY